MAEGEEVQSNLSRCQSTKHKDPSSVLGLHIQKAGCVEDVYKPTTGDIGRQAPGTQWPASHQGKFKASEKLWCKHKEGGGQKGRGEGGG